MSYDYDAPYEPRGTGSIKWDGIAQYMGEIADPLPMWVAQMDLPPAPFIVDAARAVVEQGQFGYVTSEPKLFEANAWWLETRHGWAADPAHMLACHGIGNAIGLCLRALTQQGDGVIIFTPVYLEFLSKVRRNDLTLVQSPLTIGPDGTYEMDLDALEAGLTGGEKIVLISQPHNPGGRIWSAEELRALDAFCARHGLILISDEIHQDLTMPDARHVPAAVALAADLSRLIVLGAASKTFDLAGQRTGVMTIPDPTLRERVTRLVRALDIQCNQFGIALTCAAYSPAGAAWVDGLRAHLDRNRALLAEAVAALPGVTMMPMASTYLAWLDARGTGLSDEDLLKRCHAEGLVPSPGPSFGIGGEGHLRLNIGTQRARLEDGIARLRAAFADLQ